MRESVHQKSLLTLGIKRSIMNKFMHDLDIFKTVERHHGYAIQYSYEQSFWLLLGNTLHGMGISFRHINNILNKLQDKVLKDYIVIKANGKEIKGFKVRSSDMSVESIAWTEVMGQHVRGHYVFVAINDIHRELAEVFKA